MSQAFAEAGCAVVNDVSSGLGQLIVGQLSPHMSAVPVAEQDLPADFYPR